MISHLLIAEKKRFADKYIKDRLKGKNDLLFEILPEGKKYSIGEVKMVLAEMKVYNPQKRIFYFPSFDSSSIEAQNAMLKALEEPPPNVQFILAAGSESKLLPTIVSRTKVITVGTRQKKDEDPDIATALDRYIREGSIKSLEFKYFTCKNLEEAIAISDQMIIFFKKRLGSDVRAAKILKEILRLRGLLENNNLTPQLTTDHILIFVSKTYNMKL